MRHSGFALAAAAVLVCALAQPAGAGSTFAIKTKTYDIAGSTGLDLLQAMDRKGPKHGFMTHAIAQTNYTVKWNFEMAGKDGVCRLKKVTGALDLTYTYPRVASAMSPQLHKRWNRFFAGVRKHEQHHGQIARDMIGNVAKTVSGMTVAGDGNCWKTRREAKRRVDAVVAKYEAMQVAFDEREHRDGGPVEALVRGLVGKK